MYKNSADLGGPNYDYPYTLVKMKDDCESDCKSLKVKMQCSSHVNILLPLVLYIGSPS